MINFVWEVLFGRLGLKGYLGLVWYFFFVGLVWKVIFARFCLVCLVRLFLGGFVCFVLFGRFGLVYLVYWVWFGRFTRVGWVWYFIDLVGLIYKFLFSMLVLVGLV